MKEAIEAASMLLRLCITVGVLLGIVYLILRSLPKNSDQSKRSVVTIFGKPRNIPIFPKLISPFKMQIIGYEEVPYEFQVKVPQTKMMSKEADPIEMRVEDMSFTLRVSDQSPVTFLNTGGEEAVKKEALGMVIAGLQEFAANSTRTSDELKKAQPYMVAAIINYIVKGNSIDVTNEAVVKEEHDKMASKTGDVEIPALGVKLVQMDIGRIVEPQSVIEANTAIAEQEAENARKLKVIEGVTERLRKLREVDPDATLEALQIQEGIRVADERKITVNGTGEADKMIGGIVAALEGVGGGKTKQQKKTA